MDVKKGESCEMKDKYNLLGLEEETEGKEYLRRGYPSNHWV